MSLRFVLSRVCVFLYSLGPRRAGGGVLTGDVPTLVDVRGEEVYWKGIGRQRRRIRGCVTGLNETYDRETVVVTGNADDVRRQFEISEQDCTGGSRKYSDIRDEHVSKLRKSIIMGQKRRRKLEGRRLTERICPGTLYNIVYTGS